MIVALSQNCGNTYVFASFVDQQTESFTDSSFQK